MRFTRRRLIGGMVGSIAVVAASAESLLGRSGALPGHRGVGVLSPSRASDLVIDFSRFPDQAGWTTRRCAFVATHEPRAHIDHGHGVINVPVGLNSSADNQPLAMLVQDRDCAESWQTLLFAVTGDRPRPGLLLSATTNRDYLVVEVDKGILVLSRCENSTRAVLHTAHAQAVQPGRIYQLDVQQQSGVLRARLCRPADVHRTPWQLVVRHSARRGQLGVCITTNAAATAQSLKVRSYTLHGVPSAATPPRAAVLITGMPTEAGALVRVICDQPSRVSFEYADNAAFEGSQTTSPILADASPFSARERLPFSGPLFWRAHLESASSGAKSITETQHAAPHQASAPLVIGAASCAQLWNMASYVGLRRFQEAAPATPSGLVYQGDFGYPSNTVNSCYLAQPDFYLDRLIRFLRDPYFQRLRASMPVGFTMDDHDYGPPNNADRTTLYPWTISQWNTLHADPSPRGFFDWRLGDTLCLTLDGRRYCDPVTDPNTPTKTKLGTIQKQWLKDTITNSDARLILVFSADIFASRKSLDCFIRGWPNEYDELITFFSEVQTKGRRVVILSGDAHGLRIHHHPDPTGQTNSTVVEFVCSGLRARTWSMNATNDPTLDPTRRVKGKSGLGMVVIDPTSRHDRSVTLRAIAGDISQPLDLFPPLVLPFTPDSDS